MRTACLTVSSSSYPDRAYVAISRFEEYPNFVNDISSITVRPETSGTAPPNTMYSDWEVNFRNGPLKWTEVDYHDPVKRQISFEQHSGDFEVFRGLWRVDATDTGSRVGFEVTFDFGIPSLAGVLEPIAERVLKESIYTILDRILENVALTENNLLTSEDQRAIAAASDDAYFSRRVGVS
ncbi:hypothetical protein MSTE_02493 [Mycobacteroides stephanolepidis]|uniref:Coenzyme Q-binding protein COQ10 START domain-containing protein n=1 Tax=[Mycobacterium] stephanolepidis TaxID=1520670 RepID=A0A1Z4EXV6_9MYCO|nr:SRPBCC family protein [[Mycobacterium] stephanolepidis]BAX97803.1 hypothetical protein MSTE_02493 [[Mycobacterium] stephanolepidis]